MKEKEATPATEDNALRSLLGDAATLAAGFLEELPGRRVTPSATADELREEFGGPLPEGPMEPRRVLAELARSAEPGLMATPGGRFFGFVIGGSLPAALAADWLTSAWDQNAGLYAAAPAASVVEEVCGAWLVELFGLPEQVSYGLVTSCQMANFTALAAARHSVLEAAGWDVEANGLIGSPPIRIIVGEERHVTIDRALRFLGLGTANLRTVPADARGGMRADALKDALAESSGPTIVCAQAGNVNTGAVDPPPRHLRRHPRGRRLGPRRRGLRDVGGHKPDPAASHGRDRARRLLGHRRPQVAERSLRLWPRVLRSPGCAQGGDGLPRELPSSLRGSRAGRAGLEPRLLTPGQGLPSVRGTALARPVGRR